MRINTQTQKHTLKSGTGIALKASVVAAFMVASNCVSIAQVADPVVAEADKSEARVTGLRHISIHVMQLEKTLTLYRDILGFKMDDAQVLKMPGIDGMLVMKLKADDLTIALSLPASPESLAPIGNTNHNHFMLRVNDIEPIGDKLKAAGYELENDNYAKDKWTFFTGPNGEIVGLASYD